MANSPRMIRIGLLDESPMNPRKAFGDLTELVASVIEHGILQAIMVRPVGDRFELVFGHRRLRAAREAGLEEVPCIVCDLGDAEAFAMMLVENDQRASITPLEEADAIRRGIDELGLTVETLARQISRLPSYVAARYAIACAPAAVRHLLDDELVTVGAATMLARAPGSKVNAIAERARKQAAVKGDALTRRDIALLVDQYARLLAEAPFAIDDAKLTRLNARPCTTCTDRTGAQGALFSDAAGDDRCLDSECWQAKVEGLWERARKDAKKRKLTVLQDPWDGSHTGYVESRAQAYAAGKSEPWSAIVDPSELVVGRTPEGKVVELVGPATVERFRVARHASGESSRPEIADMFESDVERDARLARAREQRDQDALSRHYSPRVVRLLERFDAEASDVDALRVLATPKDGLARIHAMHLGLIKPGHPDSRVEFDTWIGRATERDLIRLLMATAIIDGWLDDEDTLEGLLSEEDEAAE